MQYILYNTSNKNKRSLFQFHVFSILNKSVGLPNYRIIELSANHSCINVAKKGSQVCFLNLNTQNSNKYRTFFFSSKSISSVLYLRYFFYFKLKFQRRTGCNLRNPRPQQPMQYIHDVDPYKKILS